MAMSKRDKLIQKALDQRPLTFEEVVSILTFLGYDCRVHGSHHNFYQTGWGTITIPRQHPLKRPYQDKLREVLKQHGY